MTAKKRLTRGVTFRIPENVLELLEKYAKKQHVSLNSLVNKILVNYENWDSTAVDAGWLVFPKPILKKLIDQTDDKNLMVIAKDKAEYFKDIQLLMVGEISIDGFLNILKNRCRMSGFPFKEIKNDEKINFIIQHDMGKKWSSFHKIMYAEVINHIGYRVDITTTLNTIVLHINLK